MKKTNFFASFKNLIVEWIDTTTSRDILMSRNNQIILQFSYLLITIFFFLISSVYCSYTLWTSLYKYFQYDTVTSVKIIQEIPTNFPAITFCSLKQRKKIFNEKSDQEKEKIVKSLLLHCEINWKYCTSEDFKYFYDPQFGDCFTFNNDDVIIQTTVPGPDFGLSVDFFLGNPTTYLDSRDKFGDTIG